MVEGSDEIARGERLRYFAESVCPDCAFAGWGRCLGCGRLHVGQGHDGVWAIEVTLPVRFGTDDLISASLGRTKFLGKPFFFFRARLGQPCQQKVGDRRQVER
jgi:hypothetical protein